MKKSERDYLPGKEESGSVCYLRRGPTPVKDRSGARNEQETDQS